MRSFRFPLLLLAAILAMPPAHAQSRVLRYAGVNLAGAEFNSGKRPGVLNKDYTYPAASDFGYFAGKGMNIVRLPVLWERLQPAAKGELDATQLALVKKAIGQAEAQGQHVILDVHNYAKYQGARIGSEGVPVDVLVDLWQRLATEFKDDDAVMFGLMNEPNAIGAGEWAGAAQAAIEAIRAAGANNLILAPGTAWTGAHSWASSGYGGTSNATALQGLRDPANRTVVEVHQYLDADYSGTSADCASPTIGVDKLRGFTEWLRQQGRQGFLAEFGAGPGEVCQQAVDNMLGFIEQNGDVWLGWTWWAAGGWWKPDYPFNVQPGKDGSEKPSIALLERHARAATQP
ncbi:MAG: glycoside hydrolase family 5 protein [Pseudoxanthomonas sp.]|nr:glycoside hydrolase family 5 protein [Pseudoxanthomonas sp.]